MRSTGTLSILLAITLCISGVALSGHLSSHNAPASEMCSLCVHAAGSGNAIIADDTVIQAIPLAARPEQPYTAPFVMPVSLHIPPGRAPPSII